MKLVETFSIRGAEEDLKKKDALETCHSLVTEFNLQLKNEPDKLHALGFEPEVTIPVKGLNPRFDAYHRGWKIGVELEKREQMNVRSHLLFTEIAYQKKFIETAIYILPIRTEKQGKKANFSRTLKELSETDLFSEKYFTLEVPIYLIGFN